VVPFDEILDVTAAGRYQDQAVDAGLIIHEGQLTYAQQDLQLVVDLGKWWQEATGLPLPLGANAARKDLGADVLRDVNRLLRESIRYGLEHRAEALEYALGFGRGLERGQADTFVGMYVNDWTLDFGPRGREAIEVLLTRGHEAGVLPTRVTPEFVE
jgi:1,4-dihydroxy-6-naphthoate synthase